MFLRKEFPTHQRAMNTFEFLPTERKTRTNLFKLTLRTSFCRLLCGNAAQMRALLSHEALRSVGETLKSELEPVYTAALKTIAEFSKFE